MWTCGAAEGFALTTQRPVPAAPGRPRRIGSAHGDLCRRAHRRTSASNRRHRRAPSAQARLGRREPGPGPGWAGGSPAGRTPHRPARRSGTDKAVSALAFSATIHRAPLQSRIAAQSRLNPSAPCALFLICSRKERAECQRRRPTHLWKRGRRRRPRRWRSPICGMPDMTGGRRSCASPKTPLRISTAPKRSSASGGGKSHMATSGARPGEDATMRRVGLREWHAGRESIFRRKGCRLVGRRRGMGMT